MTTTQFLCNTALTLAIFYLGVRLGFDIATKKYKNSDQPEK